MTKLLLAVSLFVTLLQPAAAQMLPPNEAGMTMGHVHLNVRDVAAHKRFWIEQIGAKPVRLGTIEGVQIPGLLILLRQREPSGTVAGSVVNHLGLKVLTESRIILSQSRHKEDCFQKAVTRRGLRMRRSAWRARPSSSQ